MRNVLISLLPCGHAAKRLGHCVLVCSIDCDLDPPGPRCTQCDSTALIKHSFGDDAHGRWHNERLPDAVRCTACGNVMHYGGKRT